MKILYIEDSELVRPGVIMAARHQRGLSAEIVSVLRYRDAKSVLDQNGPFDGVVMNFQYDGLEGGKAFVDFYRYLRDKGLPIFIYSSLTAQTVHGKLAAGGAAISHDHIFELGFVALAEPFLTMQNEYEPNPATTLAHRPNIMKEPIPPR